MSGVPRIILTDVLKQSYVQSDSHQLWYNNVDTFTQVKPCTVSLSDVLDYNDDSCNCIISRCNNKRCKTCPILNTDTCFTSALTRKDFYTKGHGDFTCKTSNVIYGIECSMCGLIYVGETQGALHKRINAHRSEINNGGTQVLYKHFNQQDHSVLSMKVRIIEKIYHHTNSPTLSRPYRIEREEFWIRQLGTAMPYGCNDNIKSLGNLSSPACSSVNVMDLFKQSPRRSRSHGHRHYKSPDSHDITFNKLLQYVNKPLGIHHIRTDLYAIPLSKLRQLRDECLNMALFDQFTSEYRLLSIILDIAFKRLDKPIQNNNHEPVKGSFLKLNFANKGIDAIHISNILHNKKVTAHIPKYFKNTSTPIISFTY